MSDKQVIYVGEEASGATLLFIVFLVLKLTGVITWSWWWVTAPLWGGLALYLAFVLFIGLVGLIILLILYLLDKFGK